MVLVVMKHGRHEFREIEYTYIHDKKCVRVPLGVPRGFGWVIHVMLISTQSKLGQIVGQGKGF